MALGEINFQDSVPDTGATFVNAFKVGRDLAGTKIQDNAMTAYGQNPDQPVDPRLAAVNPALFSQVQARQQAAGDRQSSIDQATAEAGGNFDAAKVAAARRGATADVSQLNDQQRAAAADFADQMGGIVHGIAARTQDPAQRISLIQHLASVEPRIAAVLDHAGINPATLTPQDVSDQSLAAVFESMQGLKASLAADKPEIVGKDSSLLFKPGSLGAVGGGAAASASPDQAVTPAGTAPTPEVAGGVPGMVAAAAQKYGVDPNLALAVAHTESNFNPSAKSPKGALGVMQLMPHTAQSLGVDASDLGQNIDGGVRYLAQLAKQFGNDPRLIAAAYNAGPGAVVGHGGVPPYPETQAYVAKVTGKSPGSYDVASLGATPPPPSGPTTRTLPGGYSLVTPGAAPGAAAEMGHMATPEEVKAANLPAGTKAWFDPKKGVIDLPKDIAAQLGGSDKPPGDATKSGSDYLATLDPAMRAKVLATVDGRSALPAPTSRAYSAPEVQQLLNAVALYDPSFDAAKYPERAKMYQNATSGEMGRGIFQLNKVAGHLKQLDDTIDAMHNGSFTPLNAIGNTYSKIVGEPSVTNFEQARTTVLQEVEKLFKGGAADVEGTKRAIQLLSDANSPAQLHQAVGTIAKLVNEQMDDMKLRYDSAMGGRASTLETVSPQAKATLSSLAALTANKSTAAPKPAPTAAPRPAATRVAPTAAHRMSDADLKASLGL